MPLDQLERARRVERPTREAMLQRAPSVQQFWRQHRELFENAWHEWEHGLTTTPSLDASLYDADLGRGVEQAWQDPGTESSVAKLWEPVVPGVYKAQFFDPARLSFLRNYLAQVSDANIPLRPPYGLVLNRGGAMLDARSEGYLAAPGFQSFYRDLMDTYMRPISRLLFPEVFGYDTQTFGFSIQWQEGKDTSLRPHSDASSVTLNINLNLPNEKFAGSAVTFFDTETGAPSDLLFTPGMAVIHRGHVPHASQPIRQGERSNFVLWLYGDKGEVPAAGSTGTLVDARDRWNEPSGSPDNFAPF